MPLLRLPQEILIQICDELGPSFFKEDPDRLTLSKYWFQAAFPTCLRCINLYRETLRGLVILAATKAQSLLKHNLEELRLELTEYPFRRGNLPESSPSEDGLSDEGPSVFFTEPWMTTLDDELKKLTVITRQCRKLRTLRIRAYNSLSPETISSRDGYLSLPTMRRILSVENLSVLVLDLSTNLLPSPEDRQTPRHICPAIAAHLHTLRTLHLRMRSICPDVLKPQDPSDNLPLSVVAINLSLAPNLLSPTAASHSKRCGTRVGGQLELRADLKEQAEALVARMASPQTVRILTHTLPQFDTHALDVVTGNTLVLEDDAPWDGEGRVLGEDSEPDSS